MIRAERINIWLVKRAGGNSMSSNLRWKALTESEVLAIKPLQ